MSKLKIKGESLLLDALMKRIFFIAALFCTAILLSVIFVLFREGIPLLKSVTLKDFLFGIEWNPSGAEPRFGILALIAASIFTTLLACLIAVPLAIAVAVYNSEIARPSVKAILTPGIEIVSSVPPVILGFFGITLVAPFLQDVLHMRNGLNMFSAAILLAFIAIPSIASISEKAIAGVPSSLKEASYALGANRWQTIFHITVPTASPGICTAVFLGISRVAGETMVVLMVAGGAAALPESIFSSVRPLASAIVAEAAVSAVGTPRYYALFAIGIVLIIFTALFNMLADRLGGRYAAKPDRGA